MCNLYLKNKNQAVYYFKKFTKCFDELNYFDKKQLINMVENYNLNSLDDCVYIDILKEISHLSNIIKIKMLI